MFVKKPFFSSNFPSVTRACLKENWGTLHVQIPGKVTKGLTRHEEPEPGGGWVVGGGSTLISLRISRALLWLAEGKGWRRHGKLGHLTCANPW